MEYEQALDQLEELVKKAKSVPLSASAVIPREEAAGLIETLRRSIPTENAQARAILADRDAVLAQARAEAGKILEDARAERSRLISKTEVAKAAEAHAAKTLAEAETASAKLKVEADDYADAKLASFEILLNKTLRTVTRGRETLRQRLEAQQDEVAPLNLEDSGEISHQDLQLHPASGHDMP